MKLVVLLLFSCMSATWQQNAYWNSFPYAFLPSAFYSYSGDYHSPQPQIFFKQSPNMSPLRPPNSRQSMLNDGTGEVDFLKVLVLQQAQEANKEYGDKHLSGLSEARFGSSNVAPKRKPHQWAEDRLLFPFRWFGINHLASYILNSLGSSFTTSSTVYTTRISTLSLTSFVTCYTSTMFKSTTACRRKRMLLPGLLVGDDGKEADAILASKTEDLEPSVAQILGAEDRIVEIESSQQVDDTNALRANQQDILLTAINRFRRRDQDINDLLTDETVYIVTSTRTSYWLETSTTTKTVTNIASSTALTCLPACFTLC